MSLLKEVDCKLIIKSKNTFPGVEDLKDSPPTTGRLGFPKAVCVWGGRSMSEWTLLGERGWRRGWTLAAARRGLREPRDCRLSEMRSLDRRLPAGSWHGACLSTLLSEVLLEGKEKKNDPSSYSKSWGSWGSLSSQKAVVESEPADAAQETGKEGKESSSFFLIINVRIRSRSLKNRIWPPDPLPWQWCHFCLPVF